MSFSVSPWMHSIDKSFRHNTTLSGTPGKLDPKDVGLPADENLSPAPVPQELEEWFYVDRERVEDDKKLVHGDDSLCITLDLA